MKSLQISLTVFLVIGVVNHADAQVSLPKNPLQGVGNSTNSQAVGKSAFTSGTLDQLGQLLSDGGLAALLRDVDLAKLLGLDFEQWMMAQYLIDEYQNAVMYYWMIDPQGQNPGTWQSLSVIQAILELQLYQVLTPAQQQQLDQIYQQFAAGHGTSPTQGITGAKATAGK